MDNYSQETEEQIADTRAGYYYVSVIDGSRKGLVSGPYETHGEALQAVERVRRAAEKVDPRAVWYAFGTARCEHYSQPGVLGKL
jgi:hypothetical protein